MTRHTSSPLVDAAFQVLRDNDRGHMITAAPDLYPHQWSWDAALISVGLAHQRFARAIVEWRTIFEAQWSTGMLPHIVFDPDSPDYFPGFDAWGTEGVPARPTGVLTSGIAQPPVHAMCVELVADIGRETGGEHLTQAEAFVVDAVPRLLAWHDWWSTARDPENRGLLEIHHGWESGMDNSPRFDPIYERIQVDRPRVLPRTDLRHADAVERPSDREYQRYLHLIDQLRSVNFDDTLAISAIDFRCGDVFSTACLAASSEALARMADNVGETSMASRERERAQRCRDAVLSSIDPESGLCRDWDYTASAWLDISSIAGFSLLVSGGPPAEVARQRDILRGTRWMGHPDNRYPVPPSISLDDPAFRPREYWRGPTWPIVTWLFAETARRRGDRDLADELRVAGLDQLADLEFGEYYEPLTGEPLGSHRQSWTAMAAIDWTVGRRWA